MSFNRQVIAFSIRNSWLACLAVSVPLVVPVGGEAQEIIDCRGHTGGRMEVYLNELRFAREPLEHDNELARFAERLSFKLQSQFGGFVGSTPLPLGFVHCSGRRPTPQDFNNQNLIEKLDDDKVILEVLGLLDGTIAEDGTVSDRKANICFVLVPVMADNENIVAKQFVQYPKTGSGDLINLLGQSVELEAFVAAGVGIRFLRDRSYDAAYEYLNRSLTLLNFCDGPAVTLTPLTEYVEKKKQQTVIKARQDEEYEGALRDLVDD